jgi:hypothetical protein
MSGTGGIPVVHGREEVKLRLYRVKRERSRSHQPIPETMPI